MNDLYEFLDCFIELTENLIYIANHDEVSFSEFTKNQQKYTSFFAALKRMISNDVYVKYEEFFNVFLGFCKLCESENYWLSNRENMIDSLSLIIECINDIKNTYEEEAAICPCCQNRVIYKPLDDYYDRMTSLYGGKPEIDETLNKMRYTCPCCGCSDRDRLIISFLKKIGIDSAPEDSSILQIAPAASIHRWLKNNCPQADYKTADLFMDGVDYKSDIQDMKEISDESFDIIICSHVLEHVKDDVKALNAMKRILKADGKIVFLVPVDLGIDEIDEEWGCSEEENWRRFGQGDHCRRYSKKGLLERLESVFYVHSLGKEYFGEDIFRNCGLTDTSVLYVLTKSAEVNLNIGIEYVIDNDLCENGPLVSVLLPCYNHEQFVAEAIESVLNQSYKNIEFIIGDDASTDGTVAVIKKYSSFYAKEVYNSENTAILDEELWEYATGKYVALMHSDDIWDKDKIALQVAYMEGHPECGACFTWTDYVTSDLKRIDNYTFIKKNRTREEWMDYFWNEGNALCNPSSMVRNGLSFKRMQFGFENRQLPDFFKWVNFVQNHDIYILQKRLTFMRRHSSKVGENTSAVTNDTRTREMIEHGITWLPVIRAMDDDFFVNSFKKYLIDKNVTDPLDIKCEKLLLLLAHENKFIQHSGLYYYVEIYEEVGSILKEKYGYTGGKFRKDELDKGFGSLVRIPVGVNGNVKK